MSNTVEVTKDAPGVVNGIDTQALFDVMAAVREDPDKGRVSYHMRTDWDGQSRAQLAWRWAASKWNGILRFAPLN